MALGAVGVGGVRQLAGWGAVAQGDPVLAFQPIQGGGVGEVVFGSKAICLESTSAKRSIIAGVWARSATILRKACRRVSSASSS